jgi:hypothetical protein
MIEYSPEKAGVGGSTPSLAAMFSITCTAAISRVGCQLVTKKHASVHHSRRSGSGKMGVSDSLIHHA